MTLKNEIVNIIGAGGHARPVLEVLNENYKKSKKYIYDINFKKKIKKEKILGSLVKGSFKDFTAKKFNKAYIAIGDNILRKKIFNILKKNKIQIPNLISKDATVSKYLKIGIGNFINRKVFIGAETIIGNNNIINTGSLIEHQVKLGSNSHVGPSAIIGGHVKIGNNVLIGLGAKIINNVKICNNCTIGVGSVVTKSINKPGTYAGIPAKKLKKLSKN